MEIRNRDFTKLIGNKNVILNGDINMLFEVYRDKKRLMYTEHKECIPSIETIKNIKAAGYKVLLDGKAYKTTKGGK
jgi:predicted ribosome-associated RNA-binding protein Tma20